MSVDAERKPRFLTCRQRCPGGNECLCNGAIDHTLHICGKPGCACHQQERYEASKDARKGGNDG